MFLVRRVRVETRERRYNRRCKVYRTQHKIHRWLTRQWFLDESICSGWWWRHNMRSSSSLTPEIQAFHLGKNLCDSSRVRAQEVQQVRRASMTMVYAINWALRVRRRLSRAETGSLPRGSVARIQRPNRQRPLHYWSLAFLDWILLAQDVRCRACSTPCSKNLNHGRAVCQVSDR